MVCIRSERLPFVHLDDMPSCSRLEWFGNLPHLECVSRLLEIWNHLSFSESRQRASVACRTWVLRMFLCQFSEVLSLLDTVIDGVDSGFCLVLLSLGGILTHEDENMLAVEQVLISKMLFGAEISLVRLFFHKSRVLDGRIHDLLPVALEFGLDVGKRVKPRILSRLDFEFIIDIKLHIFLHIFLVYDPLRIVFVV